MLIINEGLNSQNSKEHGVLKFWSLPSGFANLFVLTPLVERELWLGIMISYVIFW